MVRFVEMHSLGYNIMKHKQHFLISKSTKQNLVICCQNRRTLFIVAKDINCFWYPDSSFPYVNKVCLHKHFHTY